MGYLVLMYRKQLSQAIIYLEKLKALRHFEAENAIHVLKGEVDVHLLRGSFDTVRPWLCWNSCKGIGACGRKISRRQSERRRRRNIVHHAASRARPFSIPLLEFTNLLKLGKPARALSMLTRCVELSEKYNGRVLHLASVSLLAQVMNELDQHQEAYRILSSVMPPVIDLITPSSDPIDY